MDVQLLFGEPETSNFHAGLIPSRRASPGHDGEWWSWRIVDSKRCWYQGRPGRSKDLLHGQAIAAASRDPPGPRRQPAPCAGSPAAAAHRDRHTEGGLDRADPGADEQAAADGPAVFARAAAIASQADAAVEMLQTRLGATSASPLVSVASKSAMAIAAVKVRAQKKSPW